MFVRSLLSSHRMSPYIALVQLRSIRAVVHTAQCVFKKSPKEGQEELDRHCNPGPADEMKVSA